MDKQERKEEYVIEKAVPEDYPAILKLIQETFYVEEPVCSELGVINDYEEANNLTLDSLKQGYTMVAKTKFDRKIAGVLINECAYIDSPEEKENYAKKTKHWSLKYMMRFYAFVQRYPNIFDRFIVDSLFEMTFLAVSKDHRKKGLALKLMQESMNLAKKMGFKVVRCDATSFYTSKICEKLVLKQIAQVPFDSILDDNNEPIIAPPVPHDVVRIYAKLI